MAMIALMMIGPGSVAAASSSFHLEILSNSCTDGYLSSRIKAVAGGGTSANELEVGIAIQRLRYGHWRTINGSVGFDSKEFAEDRTRHHLTEGNSLQVDPGRTYRIFYSFAAFHDDTELWEVTVDSLACSAPA
jgi:hypothetical protein